MANEAERPELISWAEQTEQHYMQFLREFDEKVWPLFQRRGYSKDAALMVWSMRQLQGDLENLESLTGDIGAILERQGDSLYDDDDDDDKPEFLK
jgi:hypothetical protein